MPSSIERRRELLLSLLIVAFIGVKAGEVLGRVESWPLTRMPMFARYFGPGLVPWAVTLEGRWGGEWRPLAPGDFLLTPDEMLRRVQGDAAAVSRGCGLLWRSLAMRPGRPDEMRARVRRVPRPGVPDRFGPAELLLPCA